MGTVTQYNLANVRDSLGGGNPVYMSNYYRGGPYVPATRTTTTTLGPYYPDGTYDWQRKNTGAVAVYWAAAVVASGAYGDVTSISAGGFLYLRGAFVTGTGSNLNPYRYYVSQQSSTTISINTGVPSSGTISISQLYGAQNP